MEGYQHTVVGSAPERVGECISAAPPKQLEIKKTVVDGISTRGGKSNTCLSGLLVHVGERKSFCLHIPEFCLHIPEFLSPVWAGLREEAYLTLTLCACGKNPFRKRALLPSPTITETPLPSQNKLPFRESGDVANSMIYVFRKHSENSKVLLSYSNKTPLSRWCQ